MPRKLTRRRQFNYKPPREDTVERSVLAVINAARRQARKDHRDSFATPRERDLITSIYLDRASARLKGLI